MLKLMTLNLWGYNDWANRVDTIARLLQDESPDIIALQEIKLDSVHSPFPQSTMIARVGGYPYVAFAPAHRSETGVLHGLALISRHPITASEVYILQNSSDFDEVCITQHATLEIEGKTVDICNVHFGNTDVESERHLRELHSVIRARKSLPIIAGDFNDFDLARHKMKELADYVISTDVVDYVSMPKDSGTLDYIAAPTSRYQITSVTCSDLYVSDHRAVVATLNCI